jgi:hypothetical protein
MVDRSDDLLESTCWRGLSFVQSKVKTFLEASQQKMLLPKYDIQEIERFGVFVIKDKTISSVIKL